MKRRFGGMVVDDVTTIGARFSWRCLSGRPD
jgi:hypothetical protein